MPTREETMTELQPGLPEYLAELHAENERLRAEVAGYRLGTVWDTTCLNCASLLDQNYQDYVRAQRAEEAARTAYQEGIHRGRRSVEDPTRFAIRQADYTTLINPPRRTDA